MSYKKYKQYRLPGYDYSSAGDYFITICTKDRVHYFGEIIKASDEPFIELSAMGLFVNECVQNITKA